MSDKKEDSFTILDDIRASDSVHSETRQDENT